MSLVIACPNCRQKARVAGDLVGQSVKCPACSAILNVPADAAATPTAAALPVAEPVLVSAKPTISADIDVLQSVRVGTSIQVAAQIAFVAALAMLVLLVVMFMADQPGGYSGTNRGQPGKLALLMPLLLVVGGAIVLMVGLILSVVASALCTLAPAARLARGLAIGSLVITLLSLEHLISAFGWTVMIDEVNSNNMGARANTWLPGITTLFPTWLFEVARLSLLGFFWRAMNQVLHDRRAATQALRFGLAVPTIHLVLFALAFLLGYLGEMEKEFLMLIYAACLGVQFLLVFWSILIAARLSRRLRAAEFALA